MAKLVDLDGLGRYNTKLNEKLESNYAKKEEIPTTDNLATKDELSSLTEVVQESFVAVDEKINLKANSSELATVATSGSYNDLLDQPEIPSIAGLASETYVNNAVADKATTSYVDTKVANLVNSAPETLDTLGEVATAIAENETVVEALNSAIGKKADKTEIPTNNNQLANGAGYVTSSGSVASATKATQDGSGNVITSTYATKAEAGEITTISKEITVNTDWTDTGITGSDLSSGTYIIQANCNWKGSAGLWNETYSGIMHWYANSTNSPNSTEILLHNSGLADNAGAIYLRTIRNYESNGGKLRLQIASKIAYESSTQTVTFKFRKLI